MGSIRKKASTKEYKKTVFLQDLLSDTETRLVAQGFDALGTQEKQRILEEEKMFYITKFLNSQASNEEEKGWTVSGWGL